MIKILTALLLLSTPVMACEMTVEKLSPKNSTNYNITNIKPFSDSWLKSTSKTIAPFDGITIIQPKDHNSKTMIAYRKGDCVQMAIPMDYKNFVELMNGFFGIPI